MHQRGLIICNITRPLASRKSPACGNKNDQMAPIGSGDFGWQLMRHSIRRWRERPLPWFNDVQTMPVAMGHMYRSFGWVSCEIGSSGRWLPGARRDERWRRRRRRRKDHPRLSLAPTKSPSHFRSRSGWKCWLGAGTQTLREPCVPVGVGPLADGRQANRHRSPRLSPERALWAVAGERESPFI